MYFYFEGITQRYGHPTSPFYNVDVLAQKFTLQKEETKDHFKPLLTSYFFALVIFS